MVCNKCGNIGHNSRTCTSSTEDTEVYLKQKTTKKDKKTNNIVVDKKLVMLIIRTNHGHQNQRNNVEATLVVAVGKRGEGKNLQIEKTATTKTRIGHQNHDVVVLPVVVGVVVVENSAVVVENIKDYQQVEVVVVDKILLMDPVPGGYLYKVYQ